MISENRVMYWKHKGEIFPLTVKKIKKGFSGKRYIIFKNSKKKINVNEIHKSLFFTLKGAVYN